MSHPRGKRMAIRSSLVTVQSSLSPVIARPSRLWMTFYAASRRMELPTKSQTAGRRKINAVRGSWGEQGIYDAEKKDCDCSYPYFLKNGRCENLTEECTAKYGVNGSVEGDGTCGCTIGYVLKNEQCVSVDGICKAQFGEGAERVEFDDTKCQCGTGYQWNEAGDKCVCVKDHHLEGGTCVKSPFCGWGSYNPETKKCVCDKGTIMKNGSCSKPSPLECGYSGTFNTETGRCDCDHGYYEKNGKCTYIPYCGDGNFNTKTEQCDCEEGATLRNGICNKPFGL
jgi:hypothetical protein